MKVRARALRIAALLSATATPATAELPEKPAFRIAPSTEVQLTAPGQQNIRIIDLLSSTARLEGRPTADYPQADRSSGSGAAAVDVLRAARRSITVRMSARSEKFGWSSARSVSRARLLLDVPPDLEDLPTFLKLSSTDPDATSVRVILPDGTPLKPVAGKAGTYVLDGKLTGEVHINAVVEASAGDSVGRRAFQRAKVDLTATIEAGPILFSMFPVQFIKMGDETNDYQQVGSIRIDGLLHCTGTVIGQSTVLTAAHCLAGYEDHTKQGRLSFALGKSALNPDSTYPITDIRYPRERTAGFFYDKASNFADDIGLVYLRTGPSVAAMPLHQGSPSWPDLQRERLVFVGYGYDGTLANSAGVKRKGAWTIDRVDQRKISWTTQRTSTCRYDSGGPALHPTTHLLVAVTSSGAKDCTEGFNTRVDAFAPWLKGKVR